MGQMIVAKNELQSMEEMLEVADRMVKSGLLPAEINTPQKAIAIAMKGRELGIPAVQALSEIYVVKGKASLKSELILQLATERIPGFRHDILCATDEKCTIKFYRNGRAPFEFSYTMDMAIKAGLANSDTYKKYGFYMLFNRCCSFGLKMFAPDYKSLSMEVDLPEEEESQEAISNLCNIDGQVVDMTTGEILEAEVVTKTEDDVVEQKLFEEKPEEHGTRNCFKCNISISDAEQKYSKDKFGLQLCRTCQAKYNKEKKETK